jgi:hypothetical protein
MTTPSEVSMLLATSYSYLFSDPTTSFPTAPIHCTGGRCSSYLFPGGLGDMTPWPGHINGWDNADVILIHEVYGLQIDYWDPEPGEEIYARDCQIYGGDYTAIIFCIAPSAVDAQYLTACKSHLKPVLIMFSNECLSDDRGTMFTEQNLDLGISLVDKPWNFQSYIRCCLFNNKSIDPFRNQPVISDDSRNQSSRPLRSPQSSFSFDLEHAK